MKARITINETNVLTEDTKKDARVNLVTLAKTANPVAKTSVKSAAFFASPENVAAKLAAMGDENAVIAFYEIPDGKTDERKVAEYNLPKFAARLRLAATADSVTGTIFSDEKEEKTSDGKPTQDRDI